MCKFRITGFGTSSLNRSSYFSDSPVDITVYSDTQHNALAKAEKILGHAISNIRKSVIIEEILEEQKEEIRSGR